MNEVQAQKLVEKELAENDLFGQIDCIVLNEETIEKPWGWIFFFQSKSYIETGDFIHMLGGNAPMIVNRYSGELIHTGTAQPIEAYIEEYEAKL